MKFALCFLSLLACSLAAPAEQERELLLDFDWANLKPLNIYRVPDGPAPQGNAPGSRIINGQIATPNSIPYIVALIINGGSFCGGSLISNTWVLSAAHCTVSANRIQVILGAHNVNSNEATQVVRNANAVRNHASYNQFNLHNDISLIQIPSVSTSSVVQIVPLAASNAPAYSGSTAVLAGWGRTSDSSNAISPVLRRINLNVISNTLCSSTWSNILAHHICTSGVGNVGACNGDSGGPLTVNGVQVGVVSFGNNVCSAGFPTAYARVSAFRSWIQQNSGV
ncbi:brachyurin-like [Cylas formicarius]|uniref:brachyurin-like n=1 Tax=Cylas formicarius TaxID=197179 RepID=UPI0029584648|nr:brachyurin-like [Cylas formicarius]